jgi:hypothetical protein
MIYIAPFLNNSLVIQLQLLRQTIFIKFFVKQTDIIIIWAQPHHCPNPPSLISLFSTMSAFTSQLSGIRKQVNYSSTNSLHPIVLSMYNRSSS